jgi:hypothetical protein
VSCIRILSQWTVASWTTDSLSRGLLTSLVLQALASETLPLAAAESE